MDGVDTVRARLSAAAEEHLGPDLGARWSSMLTEGTRLVAAPVERARLAFGRSHRPPSVGWLGGGAPLPAGAAWPTWDGRGPLAHLATLDCREIRPHLPTALQAAGFPSEGLLSFYYFDGQVDGGVELVGALFGTDEGARVVSIPAGSDVVMTDPPAPLVAYPTVELRAQLIVTWPTSEHPGLDEPDFPAEGWDELLDVLDAVRQEAAGPLHQVGGHPDPVQGPVELEVAYGVLSGGGRNELDWHDPEVETASRDWLLLAQIDTDDRAGFMWGDAGVLYFMIRPADLASGNFAGAAFTWQCG